MSGQERCIQDFGGDTLDVDGRIILKWILKKWDREVWTGLPRLRVYNICGVFFLGVSVVSVI